MGKRLKPNEPSVINEPMDEELVVINLESGRYYNLNPSAARIWMNLERGATVEAVIKSQQANGTDMQEVTREIDAFCRYLQDENLMVAMEADASARDCEPMDYDKPEIEKFSDMQEMLLLDPIHEVTEAGWPHEAEKAMMERIFSIKDLSQFQFVSQLSIDSARIQMHFLSRESQALFTRPFAHLAKPAPPGSTKALNIYVLYDRPGSAPLETWQKFDRTSSDQRQRQLYSQDGQHLLYQHESKVLAGYNSHAQTAYYYIPSLDMLPFYEKAAPMRMIFHHLAEANGWSLVHGAAVGLDEKGILLVGAGGSGKTTTAISAALSGFDYLGDDYVILNPQNKTILSLYQSGKFRWDTGKILSGIGKLAVNSQEDKKGIFFLAEGHAKVVKKKPFCGIVIPKIGGGETTSIRRVASAKALMVLSSSTIFQMPGSGKPTLQTISQAIRGVPAYELTLSKHSDEINAKLTGLIKGL